MQLRIGAPRELVDEVPTLCATAATLVAVLAFEHWVVHRLIVIPALAYAAQPPLWTIAAMIAPELVVFFAVGLRIRSALAAVTYAGVGALLRGGAQVGLALAGEPGHDRVGDALASEFALSTPVVGLAYLLVLGLAVSWRDAERRVERGT
jgi:hypothetical protein